MRLKTMMALCLGAAAMLSGCGERAKNDGEQAAQSTPPADSKAAIRSAIIARNFGDAARRAKELTERSPEDAEAWLLLARAEALSDNEGAALDALDRAVRAGLADADRVLGDPAFDAIRDSHRFAAIEERANPAAHARQTHRTAAPAVKKHEQPEVEMTDDYIRAGDVVIKGDL
jgi:DNA-binding SARP family transcriptional activator